MSKSNMFPPTGKITGYISGCLFLLLNLMVVPSLAMEPEKILSLSQEAQFQVNAEGIWRCITKKGTILSGQK